MIVAKRCPAFVTKIVCEVIDVFKGNIELDYDLFACTAIVKPVGTDLVFWLMVIGEHEELLAAKGRYVAADFSATYSTLKKVDARKYLVCTSEGDRPSMKTETYFFRSIGQYVGNNLKKTFVQSEFLILCTPNNPEKLEIGDWVEVEGHFTVAWEPCDIIVVKDR